MYRALPQLVILLILILHHLVLFEVPAAAVTSAYLMLFGITVGFRLWPVFHLSLFMLLWRLIRFVLPDAIANVSALYLAVLFVLTLLIVLKLKPTRDLLSWFRRGQTDAAAKFMSIGISFVAGAALLLWAFWTDNIGVGEKMVKQMATLPKPLVLLLGVPLFAALNAFSEEVAYRGIFQEACARSQFSPITTIVIQALAFAALHFTAGFPNGLTGYAMTFVYGASLGYLRHRTSGILLPFITHVMADLVIIYFLCVKFL